jgi:hypothetical protein
VRPADPLAGVEPPFDGAAGQVPQGGDAADEEDPRGDDGRGDVAIQYESKAGTSAAGAWWWVSDRIAWEK